MIEQMLPTKQIVMQHTGIYIYIYMHLIEEVVHQQIMLQNTVLQLFIVQDVLATEETQAWSDSLGNTAFRFITQ